MTGDTALSSSYIATDAELEAMIGADKRASAIALKAALAAGTAYRFKFAINGTTSTRTLEVHKPTNGADVINCNAVGIVTAAANDVLTIYRNMKNIDPDIKEYIDTKPEIEE